VLTHEHTLLHWPGAEFDHRAMYDLTHVLRGLSAELGEARRKFGLGTIVDCTTVEMGRHPHAAASISWP
jgi:predicted metal-dependent phosphotriesterase family hydrolase